MSGWGDALRYAGDPQPGGILYLQQYDTSLVREKTAGLLRQNGKYRIQSNWETGLGRADLILKTPRIRKGRAVIFELKAVKGFPEMEQGCQEALDQIKSLRYQEELRIEGYEDILAYGICFYRKECLVRKLENGKPAAKK